MFYFFKKDDGKDENKFASLKNRAKKVIVVKWNTDEDEYECSKNGSESKGLLQWLDLKGRVPWEGAHERINNILNLLKNENGFFKKR